MTLTRRAFTGLLAAIGLGGKVAAGKLLEPKGPKVEHWPHHIPNDGIKGQMERWEALLERSRRRQRKWEVEMPWRNSQIADIEADLERRRRRQICEYTGKRYRS